MVLRSFKKDEEVFRQGQEGKTAFYIPTAEDLARFHGREPNAAEDRDRWILTAFMSSAIERQRPKSWFDRMTSKKANDPPKQIPYEGLTNFKENQASLLEGDIFGEMSVISLRPRSATVRARVDCEVLEFNRSVFSEFRRDQKYKDSILELYKRRTLDTHLRQLEIFQGLTDDEIEFLRTKVSLEIVPAGTIICEQGEGWEGSDPPDVFIVRNGVVQVTVNANLSVSMKDIRNWPSLCNQILDSNPFKDEEEKNSSPLEKGTKVVANPEKTKPKLPVSSNNPSESKSTLLNVKSLYFQRPQETKPGPPEFVVKSWFTKRVIDALRQIVIDDQVPLKPGDNRNNPSPEQSPVSLENAKRGGAPERGKLDSNLAPDPIKEIDPATPLTAAGSVSSPESFEGGEVPTQEDRKRRREDAITLVLHAFNELLGDREFLREPVLINKIYVTPELKRKISTFPKGLEGIEKQWTELELRTTGRAALSEIFSEKIARPNESFGPPRVLAYLSMGNCFGEIAVVKRLNRIATCIAYNHPPTKEVRNLGDVELVRIKGEAFLKLMDQSKTLKEKATKLADERIEQGKSREGYKHSDLTSSPEFREMGLFQGSRLLVIDLNACTRCGDCVEACVKTHDDGYTRLFLDGPRYDRFLVPSACRNCLNPVCMIDCPNGSINYGENRQIQIEDSCIGCRNCAEACPYDSIQMQDLGFLKETSSGWSYADKKDLTDDWYSRRNLERAWRNDTSPFRFQGDFMQFLLSRPTESPTICFRHDVKIPAYQFEEKFRLSINDAKRRWIENTTMKADREKSEIVAVYWNGQKLNWSGNSMELSRDEVRSANLLAIELQLKMPLKYGQFVLLSCFDAIKEAGKRALEALPPEKRPKLDLVTNHAVVCDLCSHIPSKTPACVTSCPHEAAFRINSLVDDFPV